MSTAQVPLLRAPVPSRGPPRLGLSIPGSSSNGVPQQVPQQISGGFPMGPPQPRPGRGHPKLSLATPGNPVTGGLRLGPIQQKPLQSYTSPVQQVNQQYSALSFAMGLRNQVRGSPDTTGVSNGLSIQEGPGKAAIDWDNENLDVDDLDDEGWKKASDSNRIEELGSLGEGAGGAVTRCRIKGGKTVFAMKIITTDPNPEVKKQIFRELSFNKECSSPYICKYHGAFMDFSSATISIIMEFCEGGSLDSIYREVKKLEGRTGEKVLGKIAEGVLEGLTYLSGRKIIHRDIKPSNILLCRNGQVKLCDFGVSGELIGSKGNADTFIGTSYYMAPERIQGHSYTITSDVWSLGVTLLEVAQHRFPFGNEADSGGRAGLIDLLTYIVRQPIPELKDEPHLGIKWSDNFKYFIRCCLEKDTARRASPWRMLEHPWILEMKNKRVNMAHFLAQVWDWK
ncbi:Protein kinase C signaling pathway involved MAPKK protein [Maublancomyces gigas]|uniref:Protein kinase C signaling pathway involved MAPKK protein n=1 Tax=Discina gigas TaxID=1032678 RepID=A0ABR3GN58_9PEZI